MHAYGRNQTALIEGPKFAVVFASLFLEGRADFQNKA